MYIRPRKHTIGIKSKSEINFNKLRLILITVSAFIFMGLILLSNMKVHPQGLPYFQMSKLTNVGGPFESSGSTSRYALTETIVTKGKFDFDMKEAIFASPDIAKSGTKFFSLFAPGISFLAIPFYFLGSGLGYEQITSYLLNIFFALFDAAMIMLILRRRNYSFVFQIITAFIFIFATNAFSYSLNMTQHIFAAFLVLSSIYVTTFPISWYMNLLFGLIFGAGILADIPNAFILFPVVLYQLGRHIHVQNDEEKMKFQIKTIMLLMALALVPLLVIFGWYNKQLTGSPTTIAQLLGRATISKTQIKEDKATAQAKALAEREAGQFGANSTFQTRFMLNGFYILLLSDERGWLYYSPILFIGIVGMYILYKEKKEDQIIVPLSIFVVSLLIYSMFGDPWGGWSFGARYLIPAAAAVVICIPAVLERFKKNPFIYLIVSGLITYSVFVNSLGAITTTEVPPKQEATHLITFIPYTYEYNYQLLEQNKSYSFLNTQMLSNGDAKTIWLIESSLISLLMVVPLMSMSVRELLVTLKKQ